MWKLIEMACRRSCHWWNMPNIHFLYNMCSTMSKWTRDFIVARMHGAHMQLITNGEKRDPARRRREQSRKNKMQTKWIHLRLLLNYFSGATELKHWWKLRTPCVTANEAIKLGAVSNLPFWLESHLMRPTAFSLSPFLWFGVDVLDLDCIHVVFVGRWN